MPTFLGIEGGGTTWKVALAKDSPQNIVDSTRFDTGTPEETFANIKAWIAGKKYDAVGVATFGPIDPKVSSKTWGHITTTPKPNWANVNVMGALTDGSVPRMFDTDVNAPALAEYMYHRRAGESSVVYITVGTGVGVGLVVNGKTIHGLVHPEGGHLPFKRIKGDNYEGPCPYHGDCVEGLSCSLAISQRTKVDTTKLKTLTDDDPVWDSVAHALASLCVSLVYIVSPERIVISGGIMLRATLFPKIRAKTLELLNGYISHPLLTPDKIDQYITPSDWGDNAGIIGALTLAKVAYDDKKGTRGALAKLAHALGASSEQEGAVGKGLAAGFALGLVTALAVLKGLAARK